MKTHRRQTVVTTSERDRVFLHVDDNLLDDSLWQDPTLHRHVVVCRRNEAVQRPQSRLSHSLVLVFDWQLLGNDVPVQERREFTEVAAHVRYVVQRNAQLQEKNSVKE